MSSRRKHEVLVIYKSGAQVKVQCDSFTVQHSSLHGLTSIKWERAVPEPLHAGVDEIAAVWQVS